MTEPTPRTDAFDLYDAERIYELELSLARKEALLRRWMRHYNKGALAPRGDTERELNERKET
jgi:hypothetical protein